MHISEIDKQATLLIKMISEKLEEMNFEEVCEFNLQNWEEHITEDKLMFSGIYLLKIKYSEESYQKWLEEFKEKWENDEVKKSALIYKKRFEFLLKNQPKDEWLPLYIGKSENIFKRVKEHIEKREDSTTSALKLKKRQSVEKALFQLKVLKVDVNKENYNLILTEIEKRLREKHNPLVGKQ